MFKNPEHDFWIKWSEIIGIVWVVVLLGLAIFSGIGPAIGTIWMGFFFVMILAAVCYFSNEKLAGKVTFAYEKIFYKYMMYISGGIFLFFAIVSFFIPTPQPANQNQQQQASSSVNSVNSIDAMSSVSGADSNGNDQAAVAKSAQEQLDAQRKSAIETAYQFLAITPSSKAALFAQLNDPNVGGYDVETSHYAVDHLKVDWNHQALLTAKIYQKIKVKHKDIDGYLTDDDNQFTDGQAKYAIKHLK